MSDYLHEKAPGGTKPGIVSTAKSIEKNTTTREALQPNGV